MVCFLAPLPSMPCYGSCYSAEANTGLCLRLSQIQACTPFGAGLHGRGWWLIPVPDHGAVSKAVQSLRATSWCWFGTRAQTQYSCSQQQGPQIPCDWCTSWHFPSPKGCARELVASGFMACRSRLARLASMVLVRSLSLHCSGILEVCLLFQAFHCKMVLNEK